MADLEQFVLGPIDLNDEIDYSLESLVFAPAKKKLQWADSPDGDGASLIEPSRYENATMEIRVRILGAEDIDEAFDKANRITDWLQEAERLAATTGRGLASTWTPAGSQRSVTVEVLAGENTERPIVVEGEDAGWFLHMPVFRYRLDLFPLWRGEPVSIAAVSGSQPVLPIEIPDVGGDVDAEAEIVITDTAGKTRNHLEIGLEQHDSDSPENLISNPGFETDTSGWGTTVASATLDDFSRSSAWSRLGGYSAHFKATATAGSATALAYSKHATPSSSYAVVPGWRYTFSVRAKILSKGTTGQRLYIEWYTAAGAAISTSSGDVVSALGEQTMTVSAEAPATAAYAIVRIGNSANLSNGAVSEFYFDAAQMLAPLLIDSDQMITAGLAGAQTTRTGAYNPDGTGNSIIRASELISTWQTLCATPALIHEGTFLVKARVFMTATSKVRFRWRVGDAPYAYVPINGAAAPVAGQWVEVELGTITIPDLDGTQSWDGRIEMRSDVLGDDGDVDYIVLIPTTRYGKARGPATSGESITTILGYDSFENPAYTGGLAGETAPVGGAWAAGAAGASTAEDGDPDDFQCDPTNKRVTRSALSDSSLTNGRYLRLGSSTPSNVTAQVDVSLPAALAYGQIRGGVFVRFVDTDNWLMAVRQNEQEYYGTWRTWLYLLKRVAGFTYPLGGVDLAGPGVQQGGLYTLKITADAAGSVAVYTALAGADLGSALLSVSADADLATGGALDDGGIGLYDATTLAAGTYLRAYDNFSASAPSAAELLLDAVCHANRTCTVRGDGRDDVCVRQSADGTIQGRPPVYRGARLYVPPAGVRGATTRILTKLRRNDLEVAADDQIADAHSVSATITPRGIGVPR